MGNIWKSSILFAAVSFASAGFAGVDAENLKAKTPPSGLALPEALQNKKYSENEKITDARIRADAGSLSRYSAKVSLSYYGPTVNDLSQKKQPNPDNSNAPINTALNGAVGVRYRMDAYSTVSFGTGIKAVTPTYGIDRFDVNDPYVSYDFTDRIGSVQMRNSPGYSFITTPEYRNSGEASAIKWDQSLAYQVNESQLFTTLDTSFGYFLYDRGYNPGPSRKGGDGLAQRYNISFYPGAKYRINDKLSVGTSIKIAQYNPRQEASSAVLWHSSVTERFFVGWAIQHDVYIQPFIDVYPYALALDMTTFNVSAVFSIL